MKQLATERNSAPPTPDNPLLTDLELRSALKLSRQTLMRWRTAGCPHFNLGGTIRYDASAVLEWAQARKRKCGGANE